MVATSKDRKNLLFEKMNVGLILNKSKTYNNESQVEFQITGQDTDAKLKTVNLVQLRPYDYNPRKTKNPKFDDIKESIRVRGLDFPPNITQRPGESFYIICDGGNTRLAALKELYEETKDPKYWSISCVYKPWKSNDADDTNAELSCLIGHLAENDLRGDLTFIERALAIKQAKFFYEKKYNSFLSNRNLSDLLNKDGYNLSHQMLAKLEQCLKYLYPSIPNILFAGMGRPQIEKLLTLRNKSNNYWSEYTDLQADFSKLWLDTLKPFDEIPEEFNLSIFQDELIGNMVNAIGSDKVSYQDIHYEIDIDSKKQGSKEEKLFHPTRVLDNQTIHNISANASNIEDSTEVKIFKKSKSPNDLTPSAVMAVNANQQNEEYLSTETEIDIPKTDAEKILGVSTENLFSQFGMTPGLNFNQQRELRAKQNGLEFANTGSQPVSDIWQIFPAFDTINKLRAEAFSLANDLAQYAGIKKLITNIGAHQDIANFSFTVEPLPKTDADNELILFIHQLLATVATDDHEEMLSLIIPEQLLFGSKNAQAAITDLLLVKIFRLIRVIRRIREHFQEENA